MRSITPCPFATRALAAVCLVVALAPALGCAAGGATRTSRVPTVVPATAYFVGFSTFDPSRRDNQLVAAADGLARKSAAFGTAGLSYTISRGRVSRLSDVPATLSNTEVIARDRLKLDTYEMMLSTVKVPMDRNSAAAMDSGTMYEFEQSFGANLTDLQGIASKAATTALADHYRGKSGNAAGRAWVIKARPHLSGHGPVGKIDSYLDNDAHYSSDAGGREVRFTFNVIVLEGYSDASSGGGGDVTNPSYPDPVGDGGDPAGDEVEVLNPAEMFEALPVDAPAPENNKPEYTGSAKLHPNEVAGLGFSITPPGYPKVEDSDRSLAETRAENCLRWIKYGFEYDFSGDDPARGSLDTWGTREMNLKSQKNRSDRVEFQADRTMWVARYSTTLPANHPALRSDPIDSERRYVKTVTYKLADAAGILSRLMLAAAYGAVQEHIKDGGEPAGHGYLHRRIAYRFVNDPAAQKLQVAFTVVLGVPRYEKPE